MILLLLILACADTEAQEPKPANNGFRCTSKQSGSTPACWNDKDWQVFCERVRCKADKADCWRDFQDCELHNNATKESK